MTAVNLRGVGVFLTGLFIAAAAVAAEPVFQAGFAERDITPEIGMEAPGGYGKAYHRSLHDPCKVRAAVFGAGPARVAIVGIDALFIRRPTVQAVRREIEEKCGIAPTAVMIAGSHSHAAGPVGFFLPGEFDDASPLVKSLVYDLEPTAGRQIAEALIALAGRLQPGAVPLPPPLPKFQGQPWSYGRLRPELD